MKVSANQPRWGIVVRSVVLVGCVAVLCSGCRSFQNWRLRRQKPALLSSRDVVPPPYSSPGVASSSSDAASSGTFTTGSVVPVTQDFEIVPVIPAAPDKAVTPEPVEKPDKIELPPTVKSARLKYTVKKDDTLWDIALMYGVTHQELAAENSIKAGDEKKLKPGQVLLIPPGGRFVPPEERPKVTKPKKTTKTTKAPAVKTPKTSRKVLPRPPDGKYTVKSGDSLWLIARYFDTTTEALRTLNKLNTDVLQVGQVLIIPETASSVPAGQVTTSTTGKVPAQAAVKQESGKTEGAKKPEAGDGGGDTQPATSFEKMLEHTVSPDETLEIIAEMYDTSVTNIKAANPQIKGNPDLHPNLKIKVPYE